DGSPNAYGFYGLSGGTMSNPNNFQIGRWGKGVVYQTGGTNTQGGWFSVGRNVNAWGVIRVSGGALVHNGSGPHIIVGEQGRGEFTVDGSGVLDCNTSWVVGNGSGTG